MDIGQTAEPEKRTGTVNEVKKPVFATDGILFALGTDLEDLDMGAPVERSQTRQRRETRAVRHADSRHE